MKFAHFAHWMVFLLPAATFATLAQAQSINTPEDAFNAGKSFAQSGLTAAGATVNSGTVNNSLPHYTTTAPESANFGNGTGNVGGAGRRKLEECKNGGKANNAFNQQECNAVNFLAKNTTTRRKFIIDKDKDPLMTGSYNTIKNPAGDRGSEKLQCHVVEVITPGTSTNEVCEQAVGTEDITCNKTLAPQCAYVGAVITNPVTNKSGSFSLPTLTPTTSPGVYDYHLQVPFLTCNSDGSAEVGFNLDTVDRGGYITVNLSNLDDAAAVSVNGYTIFAGYPNNGPMHSGSFFPQTTPAFQLGYSWVEQYAENCTSDEFNGKCKATDPAFQTFTANTKLLDFCPDGYGVTPQSKFSQCTAEKCAAPPSDTFQSIQGFFCNAEGKFLMNRHEGRGSWNGSVDAQMPLKKGTNKITVYWGTGTYSHMCGNVTVTGQIFNVAPSCDTPWVDGCSAMRAAL